MYHPDSTCECAHITSSAAKPWRYHIDCYFIQITCNWTIDINTYYYTVWLMKNEFCLMFIHYLPISKPKNIAIKHQYLQARGYICLPFSSPFPSSDHYPSYWFLLSFFFILLRYLCLHLGSSIQEFFVL